MLHMMNEARIGVGADAVTLGYTGYLHALGYARERLQGRPVTDKDPAAPPVPAVFPAHAGMFPRTFHSRLMIASSRDIRGTSLRPGRTSPVS